MNKLRIVNDTGLTQDTKMMVGDAQLGYVSKIEIERITEKEAFVRATLTFESVELDMQVHEILLAENATHMNEARIKKVLLNT